MTNNDFAKEFQNLAEEIKQDETWRRNYMQSLLRDQDKIDHARFEEKIEMVKNGLINNIPLDAIMIMSKLSKEEIENIRLQIQ